MSDCKKALEEVGGDFPKALEWIAIHTKNAAVKRSGRAANEGRIFMAVSSSWATIIEIACETDFVAMTEDMGRLGNFLVKELAQTGATALSSEQEETLKEVAGTLKENLCVRKIISIPIKEGEIVGEYLHSKNNLGVIVKAKVSPADKVEAPEVKEMMRDLAMHVAAYAPSFLSREHVDPTFLEQQRNIAKGQTQELKGKPEQVIEKILKGKVDKQIASVCLLDQAFVKNESVTVEAHVKAIAKAVGALISLVDFAYVKVGGE